MAWALSASLAGLGSALRLRRAWQPAPPPRGATAFERTAGAAIGALSGADLKAFEVAVASMGVDSPVLRRALATGAHVSAVAGLAGAWETLDEAQRAVIRDPVGRATPGPVSFAGVPARQVDATTCGPSSLALMRMIADPFLTMWVMTGRDVGGHIPLEAIMTSAATAEIRTVEERWRSLQRELHRELTRFAVGPLPWPRRFGSPPWRMDNAARAGGVRFTSRMIDDRSEGELQSFIAHASAALADGIPVPLYSGGDSTRGLAKTFPRHVTLVVRREADGFLVYEPGSAALHRLADATILGGHHPSKALGNWWRICWAVLPRTVPQ